MLVAIILLELLVASFWYYVFFSRKETRALPVTDRRDIEQYQIARSSSSSCSNF